MEREFATDYLVVGAGAMGMAFTDVLLSESDATITIVDSKAKPGGHWNDAYPFVRLHQPSSFYGVNSTPLGGERKDLHGGNAGLYELASGTEVVTYFDQLMNRRFLPSGRVRYLPVSEYLDDGQIRNLVSGATTNVEAKKTVDATYMNVTVPSVTLPKYDVAEDVWCVPLNDLPELADLPEEYVVVGGGKTAIDACLWLLDNGVDDDCIRWVVPRDQWMLDRAHIQPGEEFIDLAMLRQAQTMELVADSESLDAMFDALVESGVLLQLDESVRPSMYRCCTVTTKELEQLRRLKRVIRMGRVLRIEEDRILMEKGEVPTSPRIVHVDCTADGLARRPIRKVFEDGLITLQTVRTCQQVFSAAFIGHVEIAYSGDEVKNDFCSVVPHPDDSLDWVRTTRDNTLNVIKWNADPELKEWLARSRLDGFSGAGRVARRSAHQSELLRRLIEATPGALSKLQGYMKEADR